MNSNEQFSFLINSVDPKIGFRSEFGSTLSLMFDAVIELN